MNDSNDEQQAINSIRAKSIEAVQTAKSGQLGEPLRPTTSVTGRKGWHFASLIVLIPLGAIAIIVYLLRSVLAERYEGLGAALCAVACGGFLVWHAIHLFAEEDKLQDDLLEANKWPVSPPEENSDERQTNPTAPPPEQDKTPVAKELLNL